jgi:hypothetical protein
MAPRTELDMLTTNLAGENISLADGGLSFSVTDISIPTSMGINVDITRSYNRLGGDNVTTAASFSDWHMSLPKIEYTAINGDLRWTPNYDSATACSNLLSPGPIQAALGNVVDQHGYWNGANIDIPNVGGGKLLEGSNGGDYQTADDIKVNCAIDSLSNEYFMVYTPNGFTYKLSTRKIEKGRDLFIDFKSAGRVHVIYLVSEITDRFGNALTFDYHDGGILNTVSLTTPTTSTEEIISTTLTDGLITKIKANDKEWNYQYSGTRLNKVIRPDNKYWQYDFPAFFNYSADIKNTKLEDDPSTTLALRSCSFETLPSGVQTFNVTHPYGAEVTFNVDLQVHGRTEMPLNEMSFHDYKYMYNINGCYGTFALKNKILKVDESTTYTWDYNYTNNGIHWNIDDLRENLSSYYYNPNSGAYGNEKTAKCAASSECVQVPTDFGFEPYDLRVLTITEPDGSSIKHYISKRWDFTDNKVIATEIYEKDSTTPIKTEIKTFSQSSSKGSSGIIDPITSVNVATISFKINEDKVVNEVDGTEYIRETLARNMYEAETLSVEYNSTDTTKKRYHKTDYYHDTSNWILNQPTKKYISDSNTFTTSSTPYSETTYYASTHAFSSLPYQQKVMGSLIKTNTAYHDDGQLEKVVYAGIDNYELYDDYYRGKAQKVTLPCPQLNTCGTQNSSSTNTIIAKLDVNFDGTVLSISDFKGNVTNYDYNGVGLLTLINPEDTAWFDTNITYTTMTSGGSPSASIKAGYLKQQLSKGSYQQTTYLDTLLRPVLTEVQDTSLSNTTTYSATEYDYKNAVTFASIPSSSPTSSQGTSYEYDGLGRVKTQLRLSDNASTTYEYLSGNKVNVTDPYNYKTTTQYFSYGSYEQSKPLKIDSPDGGVTNLSYDVYGLVQTIEQGGITESRYYYSDKTLEKTSRPDTGDVVFTYTDQRRINTITEGTNLTITNHYNQQGKLSSVDYQDASLNKSIVYDESGAIESLTAGAVSKAYDYNSLGGVSSETLMVDGQSYNISYEFDKYGTQSSITYPTGRKVLTDKNALGQDLSIGDFAKSAEYYSNGTLKSFEYGNGLTYLAELNDEQMIDEITVSNTVDLSYEYDLRDNLFSLTNNIDADYNLTSIDYDALNRLESVTGEWGVSSFIYDTLGNIEQKNVSGNSTIYNYNANNRLTSVSGGVNKTFGYDSKGNVTAASDSIYTYNSASQMTNVTKNGAQLSSYLYDGDGKRVKTVNTNGTKYSLYASNGKLLFDKNISSDRTSEYFYLNTMLIAKTDGLSAPTFDTTPISPDGNFTVSWGEIIGATTYSLEREIAEGSWVQETDGVIRQWSGTGFTNGYVNFRVIACNAEECSRYRNYSVQVLFPPNTPTTITTPTSDDIDGNYTISWPEVDTASSYTLAEQVNSDALTYSTVSSTSKSYSNKPNGTYLYSVRACNISGCSDWLNGEAFNVLHPPEAPATISVPSNNYTTSASISWSSSSTATSYVAEYQLNSGSWSSSSTTTGTSKTFTPLTNGTFQFRVKACNSSGCSAYKTSSSTLNTLPPSSVSSPATTVNGGATISWGSVSTATKYTIQQKSGSTWTTLSSTVTGTSYSKSGLGNQVYQYRVAACNSSGCSAYTTSGTTTNINASTSISYANTSSTNASKDHDGTFKVSWASVPNATSYVLEQKTGSSWSQIYSGTSTSKTVTGIADGTYTYRVKACRSGLCTSYKQSSSVWVIRPNLTLSFSDIILVSPGSINLTWVATGGDYCSSSSIGSNYPPTYYNRSIPITNTTTVTVTCYFGGLSISKYQIVRVKYGSGPGLD